MDPKHSVFNNDQTGTTHTVFNSIPKPDILPPGTEVIYGFHGRCNILSTEMRKVATGEIIPFYKLEQVKSHFTRSNRSEPFIWVPIKFASSYGLRLPITLAECESAFALLSSPEYFFPLGKPWLENQHILENSVRSEGFLGLIKSVSFLSVLIKRDFVPPPEVSKLFEMSSRLLIRELSVVLQEPFKVIELKVNRCLRAKLTANH